MSDVEDGELLSSDDENICSVTEDNETQINLNDINNNLQTQDGNYEQCNIKAEVRNKFSDRVSKETEKFDRNEGVSIRNRKRGCNQNENIEMIKKRKLNYSNMDGTHRNSIIEPKRRILCKYYAAGDCKNGSTCIFMHGDFPCKFFHDDVTICRAGNSCKYSHEPLTEEMKIVLNGFIHEGKEKSTQMQTNTTFNNESFIKSNCSPQRPNCLLPTPIVSDPLPTKRYDSASVDSSIGSCKVLYNESYKDIVNYPDFDRLKSNNLANDMIVINKNIPNYPIKSKFTEKFPKPGSDEFYRSRNNCNNINYKSFHINNDRLSHLNGSLSSNTLLRPLQNIGVSDLYLPFHRNHHENPLISNEENILPKVLKECSDDKPPVDNNTQLSYKNHAPARFIIGNQHKDKYSCKQEINVDLENKFKEALKQLAEQVVVDPIKQSSDLEEHNIMFSNCTQAPEIKEENIVLSDNTFRNVFKPESSDVRISDNKSIFKEEKDMSESEKNYIDEMKRIINFDAQFENIIPWELQNLESIKKQPYALFDLKESNVHGNPFADPRLIGHPILSIFIKSDREYLTSNEKEDSAKNLIFNQLSDRSQMSHSQISQI